MLSGSVRWLERWLPQLEVEREFGGLEEGLDPQPGLACEDQAWAKNWGGERLHRVVADEVDAGIGDDGSGRGDECEGEGDGDGEDAVVEAFQSVMKSQVAHCSPTVWYLIIVLVFMSLLLGHKLTSPLLSFVFDFLDDDDVPVISVAVIRHGWDRWW